MNGCLTVRKAEKKVKVEVKDKVKKTVTRDK
jgi:hypothetical protein